MAESSGLGPLLIFHIYILIYRVLHRTFYSVYISDLQGVTYIYAVFYKLFFSVFQILIYEVYIGNMGWYCIQYSITYNKGYYIKCSTMYSTRCILVAFYEVFYNYNVFYRLRVCNKVYMGYSIEYYLGYPILTY